MVTNNTATMEFMARLGQRPIRWCHDFYRAPSDEEIIRHFREIARLNAGTLIKLRWTEDAGAAAITLGMDELWVGCVRLLD
jgi:hypothetical protein